MLDKNDFPSKRAKAYLRINLFLIYSFTFRLSEKVKRLLLRPTKKLEEIPTPDYANYGK